MTDTKLDQALPLRTAGSLPSSRTEDMLAEALASDNIALVKAQLEHVWSHYQSLEFALVLATTPDGLKAVREAIVIDELEDADPVEVTARAIAGPLLEGAYMTAHQTSTLQMVGLAETTPAALRYLYPTLDYSDPERELSDEDLQNLLKGDDE